MYFRKVMKLMTILTLILGPLLLDQFLATKDSHYSEVQSSHECDRTICEADFDGDGVLGRVEHFFSSPDSQTKGFVVAFDKGQQLIKLPYTYIDGTFRTHIALQNDSGKARLLIFDGASQPGVIVRAVYAWTGSQLQSVEPSRDDDHILDAMSARDEAGRWSMWGLYRAFSLELLIGYYILLSGIIVGLLLRPFILSKFLR